MYDLRYTNPRLAGNIYRTTHRCGKPNCRCNMSKRYWHPMYVLEYKRWDRGRGWVRLREYIPKSKVKALRQRIRRAKVRDRKLRAQRRFFLTEAHRLVKHLKHKPLDGAILVHIQRLLLAPLPEPINELERARAILALATLAKALDPSISSAMPQIGM